MDEGLDFGYGLESGGDGVFLLVKDSTELDLWSSKPRVYEDIEVNARVAIILWPWDRNQPTIVGGEVVNQGTLRVCLSLEQGVNIGFAFCHYEC